MQHKTRVYHTVRSSNDDVESLAIDIGGTTPLPKVGRKIRSDRGTRAIERTNNVGEGCWVRASSSRIDGGISLVVNVEAVTSLCGVAVLLALEDIICLQRIHAQVHAGRRLSGALKVGEGRDIAIGGRRVSGTSLHRPSEWKVSWS